MLGADCIAVWILPHDFPWQESGKRGHRDGAARCKTCDWRDPLVVNSSARYRHPCTINRRASCCRRVCRHPGKIDIPDLRQQQLHPLQNRRLVAGAIADHGESGSHPGGFTGGIPGKKHAAEVDYPKQEGKEHKQPEGEFDGGSAGLLPVHEYARMVALISLKAMPPWFANKMPKALPNTGCLWFLVLVMVTVLICGLVPANCLVGCV